MERPAVALLRGDQTLHRLQSRVNATRRSFQTALRELERLEARDEALVILPGAPDSPATDTAETGLQTLGSLRQKDPADPDPPFNE
jgi:hypothetical protein